MFQKVLHHFKHVILFRFLNLGTNGYSLETLTTNMYELLPPHTPHQTLYKPHPYNQNLKFFTESFNNIEKSFEIMYWLDVIKIK